MSSPLENPPLGGLSWSGCGLKVAAESEVCYLAAMITFLKRWLNPKPAETIGGRLVRLKKMRDEGALSADQYRKDMLSAGKQLHSVFEANGDKPPYSD